MPQSYDATMLIALAAEAAKDDDGRAMSKQIIDVSEGRHGLHAYAECADLLEQGEDIDYDGVSGPVDLNDTGSVSKATIGIQLVRRRQHVQADRLGLGCHRVASAVRAADHADDEGPDHRDGGWALGCTVGRRSGGQALARVPR